MLKIDNRSSSANDIAYCGFTHTCQFGKFLLRYPIFFKKLFDPKSYTIAHIKRILPP